MFSTRTGGGSGALRAHDRAPAGPDLRASSPRSPGGPRRSGSRRSSGPTTTRAFPARPASRPPMPGPSSPGLPATPRGSGSASSSRPSPSGIRESRQGRRDGRRDERRPGRVRAGGGLERGRASPARLPVPRRSRSGPTMLEESLEMLRDCRTSPDGWTFDGPPLPTARSTRSRSRFPAGRPPDRAARPRIIVGGGGIAAFDADRGALRGRVQPVHRRHPTRSRAKFAAARRGLRGDRSAIPRPSPARRWSAC